MLAFLIVLSALLIIGGGIAVVIGFFGEYITPLFFGVSSVVIGAVLVIVTIVSSGYQNHQVRQGCVVSDKDRTSNKDGSSDMRVYTDNCGNFTVSDMTFLGNFHSSDTFAKIKVGKTYDFETRGYRVPFLSWFPNIVSATEAN